ncbi:MAG: type III-B CRISPR module-associated protein Cmr5 [Verrucomicrobiota bacterium]
MQNLEQIRAAAALPVARKTTKADVNKLPAMIISNGLLAATAFANENAGTKRPKLAAVMNGVAGHLANSIHGLVLLQGCANAGAMVERLSTQATSAELQRATAEALAFISFVKRFANKDETETKG